MKICPDLDSLKRFASVAILLSCASTVSTVAQTDTDDEEDLFELSPFVIETSENVGYLATSTLAGSRLKTDLKDVGSAISVVTQEFLEDTGATDAQNLLVYTVSTEVGGVQGNFAGDGIATGNEQSNTDARANPQGTNRVRGLSGAAATRDYFLTAFGFDSYNTESVTISRGPNSILFGIGEPGGIIENSLKKAMFGTDITRVQLRYGQRGTHRETLDFNREVIEGRLALRLNAMNERIEYKQQPAYEEDQRWTLAAKANLLTNEDRDWMGPTTVYANFEKAEIRGTPPSATPPQDGYSWWWQPPTTPEADAMVGFTGWDAEYRANYASQWIQDVIGDGTTVGNKLQGQPGIWNSYVIMYGDRSGVPGVGVGNSTQVIDGVTGAFEMVAPSGETITTPGWFPTYSTTVGPWNNHPGFGNNSIISTDVYDWKNYLLPGRAQYANHDFEAMNLTLEQNFLDNSLGFQFVYDKQNYERDSHFPMGRHVYTSVRIDTAAYLTDGTANPNVGRPVLSGMWDPRSFSEDERISKRVTAYYNLDFTEKDGWMKWLGDHTINGLWNSWENDKKNGSYRLSWDDSHDPDQNFVGNQSKPGSWGGSMFYMVYVGDPQFNAATPADLRLYQDYLRLNIPKAGDEYTNYYYDGRGDKQIHYSTIKVQEFLQWPGASRQEIDSKAWTVQSKFFNDNIILTYGWREDTTKTYQINSGSFQDNATLAYLPEAYTLGWRNDETGTVGPFSDAAPTLEQTGETETTQVVAHVPDEWMDWGGDFLTGISFHYAESENFNPASVRRNLWGDTIGNPSGETTEHGVAVNLLDGKAHIRMTWYETTSKNKTNSNMQGSLWMLRWPLGQAQRWMNGKNGSFQEDGRSFEDYGWWSASENAAGPDQPGAEFIPERLGNFQNFDEVINAFIAAMPEGHGYEVRIEGEPGNQTLSFQDPQGLSTVADVISEGFEVELVYNITDSWRVAFNASKTESTFGNGLKHVAPFVEQTIANYQRLGLYGITDTPGEWVTPEDRYGNSAVVAYNAAAAKEGTVSTELRKWRWNAVTNYIFRDGALEGFGVGGSLRWQDKVSTGYPFIRNETGSLVPDLANPYEGDSRIDGDVWFSYKTEIKGYPVKFQLNLQNYLSDDADIVSSHNPDGTVRVIRMAPEKRWFLTTTIDF